MKLFFRELGEGQPLIILHGLFGMSDNWMTLAKKFSKANKVYIPDLRNHGQSPHHQKFSYSLLTDDLLEFIKDQNLHDITLLGHSMGGKTAMLFSLKYSAYINKLIIVDIAAKAYNITRFKSILEILRALPLNDITTRKELDAILIKKIFQSSLRQFLLKNLTRNHQNNFKWKLNIESLSKNIDKISQEIKSGYPFEKPVLLIKGAESEYVTNQDIIDLKRLFPDLQTVTIPGTTHWVHAEAPEIFYKEADNFISRNNSLQST